MPLRTAPLAVVVLLVCTSLSCGGNEIGALRPTGPSALVTSSTTLEAEDVVPDDVPVDSWAGGGSAVLVGAGDIARCGVPGAEETARLLDNIAGTVFVAGDNAYMDGSASNYRDCYDPTWGRHRHRTRPVPGNHEYQTRNASGYFGYFGPSAGPPGAGYYSYTLGSWLVLALNSEIPSGEGSSQLRWVRDQLAGSRRRCTLAYWHRPLFSSGRNGPNADMRDLWQVLYEMDVDVVLGGHDHVYERFAPQAPDGRPDPVRGIRQFTVGTGGAPLYSMASRAMNSEVIASVWGVASFTLQDGSYRWEFIPVAGQGFSDSGTGTCH